MSLAFMAASIAMANTAEFDNRRQDWRFGPVIYQVFVDRFAPSKDFEAKSELYPSPKRKMKWTDLPKSKQSPEGEWIHTLDFWGGDLPSLTAKLDYISGLGADVLYLNPIFKAHSNHKYDTIDYNTISPEFGTMADFEILLTTAKSNHLKVVLDGVFNHMGDKSRQFIDARTNPNSQFRSWFTFGDQFPLGYSGWAGVSSLPQLNLENSDVRNALWNNKDSVVQNYLNKGIDGWRIDVAFELGHEFLRELTTAAHSAKPGSLVVGEIAGYPAGWFPDVDGVYNLTAMDLVRDMVSGNTQGGTTGQMLQDMVNDAGIENLLRSWLHVDNHDMSRFASTIPDFKDRDLIRTLQFTLPGAPLIYYGTELGMTGVGDPGCRAPMLWNNVTPENKDLTSTKRLTRLRTKLPALRYGNFTALRTNNLLAFIRTTDRFRETAIVVANPTDKTVKESFTSRIGDILSWGELENVLTNKKIRSITGRLEVQLKPKEVAIFVPITGDKNHDPYRRIDPPQ